jgi:hypothetical protein
MIATLIAAVLAAEPAWEKVSETDGITIEQRTVGGSKFVELKFTTQTDKTPRSLCDAAFGDGKFDAAEPDLKSRAIVQESADERVTYEQITPPIVSNRDYVVRARRLMEGEACRMTFEAANELGPKPPDGWVRVSKLKGHWLFEPLEGGKTRLTYVVFTDPGGSIPPFLVEGNRRKLGVNWVKMIESRGKKAP